MASRHQYSQFATAVKFKEPGTAGLLSCISIESPARRKENFVVWRCKLVRGY